MTSETTTLWGNSAHIKGLFLLLQSTKVPREWNLLMTGDRTLLGNWNTRCFFFTVLESMKSMRKQVNNLVLCQGSCAVQTPASLLCLTGSGENDLFLSPPFLKNLLIPPLPRDPPSWPPLIQDKVQYKYSQHMNRWGWGLQHNPIHQILSTPQYFNRRS